MAIRYSKAYNQEISRVVRNFNAKRNRAIKKGKRLVPPQITVSDLKSRYENRRDLNRELRLIEKFGERDALTEVENLGGAKAVKWEVEYLKDNLKYAKQFFDQEIKKASYIDEKMSVSKTEYLNNLRAKRDFLELEMTNLDPSDYRTFKKTMNEYFYANKRNLESYRNWLNEVETIMRHMGYDNKTIDKFFEGFDSLTPEQFINLYRNNPIVSRLYELYVPSNDGSFSLSTSEEDAENLIDTFIEEKDQMIEQAKKSTEMLEGTELDDFVKSVEKTNVGKDFNSYGAVAGATPKINESKLTPKQIKQLKDLGWYDVVVKKK